MKEDWQAVKSEPQPWHDHGEGQWQIKEDFRQAVKSEHQPEWRRLRWKHPKAAQQEAKMEGVNAEDLPRRAMPRRLVPQPPRTEPPAWLRQKGEKGEQCEKWQQNDAEGEWNQREQDAMSTHLGDMAQAFASWGEQDHDGAGVDDFLESIYETMRDDQAAEAPGPRTEPRPERWGGQKRGTKRRAGRTIQLERLRKVLVQDLSVKLE